MKIICDMDEVLVDFIGRVLARWNSANGTSFVKGDIKSWRMEDILGKDRFGNSAEGIIDKWLAEYGFYEELEPLPGAIDGFRKLCDLGHDVLIVTSIPEVVVNAFDGKRKWVRNYFPQWSMKNFIASSRKGLIAGDVIIDDDWRNIIDWCAAGKIGALVFDAPWNRNLTLEMYGSKILFRPPDYSGTFISDVTRVYSWNDIIESITARSKNNTTKGK